MLRIYLFFILVEVRRPWVPGMCDRQVNRLSVGNLQIKILMDLLRPFEVELVLVLIVSPSSLSFFLGLDSPQLVINDLFDPVVFALDDLALHVLLI